MTTLDFVTLRQQALNLTPDGMSRELLTAVFTTLISWPSATEGQPGYRDVNLPGPGYATWQEVGILNLLAFWSQCMHPLEIGSAAGWSSVHIALGLRPGAALTCVDPFTEGEGGLGTYNYRAYEAFLRHTANASVAPRIGLIMEASPDVLPSIAPPEGWDFAFVDGWHFDEQPLKDTQMLLPFMTSSALLALHDLFYPDVAEVCRWLTEQGWRQQDFRTPNHMAIFFKQEPSWWSSFIQSALDARYIT